MGTASRKSRRIMVRESYQMAAQSVVLADWQSRLSTLLFCLHWLVYTCDVTTKQHQYGVAYPSCSKRFQGKLSHTESLWLPKLICDLHHENNLSVVKLTMWPQTWHTVSTHELAFLNHRMHHSANISFHIGATTTAAANWVVRVSRWW